MPNNASTKVVFRYGSTKSEEDLKPKNLNEKIDHFLGEEKRSEARQFQNQVLSGGSFNYSPESIALMQTEGTFASDYRPGAMNPALLAAAYGIDISSYMKCVEEVRGNNLIPQDLVTSLDNSSDVLQNLYVGDVELYKGLRHINRENQLTGIEIVQGDSDIKTKEGQLVFDYSPEEGFRPVMDIANPLSDAAKEKLMEKVGNLTKKGAGKLGKKVGTKALERATGKGIDTAVTAALSPFVSPLLAKIAGWIAETVVNKVIEKVFSWIRKNKEVFAALGLMLLGGGILTSSIPLIAAGATGLAIGGAGAIAGAATATWAFVTSLFLATAGSFVLTLIIGMIATPLLIAFIIFIITTSAYVVPGSPGSASYTCVSQLQGLGIFTNGGGRAAEYVSFVNPDVVVHFEDYGLANQTGPGTIDVGRSWSQFPDDQMLSLTRDDVISRLTELMTTNSQIEVWQAYNEPLYHVADWSWLTNMDLAVIEAGVQNNKDVCIGNFKEGYPQDLTSPGFQNYINQIMPAANSAQDEGIKVYLCVHEHEDVEHWEFNGEFEDRDGYNGRFTQLVSAGLELPVIVTVAGFDSEAGESDHGVGWHSIITPADYVDMLLEYQSATKAAGAVGVAVFQLGLGGEWDSYDITPLLDLAVDCEVPSDIPVDLSCFNIDESWSAVPDYRQKIISQLQELVSQHPGYIAKICAGGTTTISYGGDGPYHGFCPSSPGDVCTFYDRLLVLGDANIYYTLTHELGHRLNWVNVTLFDDFVTTVLCQLGDPPTSCEPQLPSYACFHNGATSTTEDFAETAAWYTQLVRYNNCPIFDGYSPDCACYNRLDDDYPLHYQFAVERIF